MDINVAIKELRDSNQQVQKMHELVRLRLELIRRNSVSEKQDILSLRPRRAGIEYDWHWSVDEAT